jgi:lipid-A-disaccharide synthase
MKQPTKQVMIIAAEASSALFAQRLLEYWKSKKTPIKAFGVGTNEMEALGFERLGKAEEMAVVGIAEVIEHYGKLKSVFDSLVEAVKNRKPDLVILMDYPDFNLKLAKKISNSGVPVVYYISPQVWVWRKGRVNLIKKYCRKVLCLFPFEVEFYSEKNVPVSFVGHPLLDEVDEKYFKPEYTVARRGRFGFGKEDTVIGLMPGSRKGELKLNFPVQIEAANKLYKYNPKLKFAVLVAPTFNKEQVQNFIENLKSVSPCFPYTLLKDDPPEMICMTDYILAASGTATLMVALLQKPMVIMYQLKKSTYLLVKMLVHGVTMVGMPNLIMGRMVVPECIQTSSDVLFQQMKKYIEDKAYADSVRHDLAQVHLRLGEKGATARVAKALEEYLQ